MRYVYIICSSGSRPDTPGNFLGMAQTMLASLWPHIDDDVALLCNWVELDHKAIEVVRQAWPGKIRFQNIPARAWEGRVAYHKIATLRLMPLLDGDEIIMTDVDTFYCGNPFDAFESDFDIAYTSRPRNEPSVNLGLLAFQWSAKSRAFVDTWIQQIKNPSFAPYVEWLVRCGRMGRQDLLTDQDFMSVAVKYTPHREVRLHDLGSTYNWYPSVDTADKLEEAWTETEEALADTSLRMIHLKGHLKSLAPRLKSYLPSSAPAPL